MTWVAIKTVLIVKAGIWLVALSSGTFGGVLAPLLIVGGAFGALFGRVLPGEGTLGASRHGVDDGRYHAGAADGHLFAVELTVDVCLLVPLFAATVASYGITVLLLMIDPDRKIARRGRHVIREYARMRQYALWR